jgi:hypothetical protein
VHPNISKLLPSKIALKHQYSELMVVPPQVDKPIKGGMAQLQKIFLSLPAA